MSSIYIKMRDGTERVFKHEGRSGGSYSKSLRYEPGFVVITDEYYREIATPTELVLEIKNEPTRW